MMTNMQYQLPISDRRPSAPARDRIMPIISLFDL